MDISQILATVISFIIKEIQYKRNKKAEVMIRSVVRERIAGASASHGEVTTVC